MSRSEKPGLQSERTRLSWERSALVFLVSGAIPLMREDGPLAVARSLLAIVAVLLAAMVVWFAVRRGRRVVQVHPESGRKAVSAPTFEVNVLGWSTAVFAAVVVVVLVLSLP